MKRLALAVLLALAPAAAIAQSSPNLVYGQVPTAGQWNSFFAAKQDVLGYVPVNKAGDIMLGKLTTVIPTTQTAGLNLPPGNTPATPANGDLWTTSLGMFVRINGFTIGPLVGGAASSFAATTPLSVSFPGNQVAYALTGIVAGANGGTGIANTGLTITLGGNLTTAGAFATTLTVTAATNATLPAGTHTLAGLDVAQTFAAAQAVSLNAGALPAAVPGSVVRIANVDATTARIVAEGYGAIAAVTAARANGTAASPTQVTSATEVGGFNWFAWGSNAAWNGPVASVRTYAAENITGTAWGSKTCIATTPTTTTALADSLCQQASGGLTIGSPTGGDKGAGTLNAATNIYVANNAVLVSTSTAGGDLSGTYPNPTVAKINGTALGSTTATSGNLLIGSGSTWVTQVVSGDATLTSGGAVTVAKVNGVAYGASPSTNTVAVITASNTASYTAVPNCANALTFDTTAHTFGCNSGAGTGTVTSVSAGTGMSFSTITTTGSVAADIATTANIWAATANKLLDAGNIFNAAGALTMLTDASTVAVDFSTGFNFTVTLGGNRTLGNPSNAKVGQTGCIYVVQDGTGSRTLAYSANWKFAGGTAPTLSTAAGAVDMLCYLARTTTFIGAALTKALQ